MCKDTAKIRKFANMITKNRIKFIRSLEQKKYRKAHGCFVVEGPKVVEDMLPAFECEYVATCFPPSNASMWPAPVNGSTAVFRFPQLANVTR